MEQFAPHCLVRRLEILKKKKRRKNPHVGIPRRVHECQSEVRLEYQGFESNIYWFDNPIFVSLYLRDYWELWVPISPAVVSMHEYSWKYIFGWWFGWFRPISSRFPVIGSDVSDWSHLRIQKSTPKNQNHHEKSIFQNCSRNVPGAFRGCGVPISTDFDVISSGFPGVSGFNHLGIQTIVPKSSKSSWKNGFSQLL